MSRQLDLFGVEEPKRPSAPAATPTASLPDQGSRDFATDPRQNVVLEASAGTGKTTVLVLRYLNLLRAGVDPANILAMTFTRKAAAEMRDRIIRELKRSAGLSQVDRARWNELRDRLSDIDISTIDAFCLSLLREFPLEADLDPGFSMADETEVPRFIEESLDRALRICLLRAREDEDLALVLAQLGISRARIGLAHLLQRRLVARQALDRFLVRGPEHLRVANVCSDAVRRLQDALRSLPSGLDAFITDGPLQHARFRILARDLTDLDALCGAPPASVRGVMDRARRHFLTKEGTPRTNTSLPPYRKEMCASEAAWKRHRDSVAAAAPQVKDALDAFARDLNVILARGVRRMFWIALNEYRKTLNERSVLDFSDLLERAIALLGQMDEFAQSRYRLEARYHHVLVDEFQDTSRAQWQLVSLLIQAWGQGSGVASDAPLSPSIFVVGDRKQSIYRFRDAEVTVLEEAARYISTLRPGGLSAKQAIAFSFRARPELLSFVNDVFTAVEKQVRPDAFTYGETDRFPLDGAEVKGAWSAVPAPIGLVSSETPEACADAVAEEVERLLGRATIRDPHTGLAREARPGDVGILFRSRASHREFETALDARGIPAYVYKGLGFFDADEIKDLLALLRYLADPSSDLRAAALLRSRIIGISDQGLSRLAPHVARALTDRGAPRSFPDNDRTRLERAQHSVAAWLGLVDQIPPAELLDRILAEAAYDYELRGPRRAQARENVKKMRALIRRIQNRGYGTMRRIAEHLDSLSAGDESNAALEAVDAVNLMTVHAAKGLEFPILFVVNLARGSGGPQPPIRVVADTPDGEPSVSVASYISEIDEDQRDRDAEETKRLLYVALTRARDALYLATVLKDGEMKPARGSLGEVLPGALRELFAPAAVARAETTAWIGPSGQSHTIRVVPAAQPLERTAAFADGQPGPVAAHDVFAPFRALGDFSRMAVTDFVRLAAQTRDDRARHDEALLSPFASAGEPIVGTIVHRLFQVAALPSDPPEVRRAADALLRDEERVQLTDEQRVLEEASTLYCALALREELRADLSSGVRYFEVPFALRLAAGREVILRGSIDCLVQRPDGSVLVLEFKTGRRSAAHEKQLEIYVTAARAMFPGAHVEGKLVSPEPEP
ncbi:MAG: UvrD-helicase domain-containing protein [Acidobacteriota bacterium]